MTGRVRIAAAAALALAVATLAVASAGATPIVIGDYTHDGKPCSREFVDEPVGAPPLGGHPLVLGDSVSVWIFEQFADAGYQVNAQGCRSWSYGVKALERLEADGELPRVVLLQLGTSQSFNVKSVRKAIDVAGPHRWVGLVTSRQNNTGLDAPSADSFRRAAAREDRAFLVDWSRFSRGQDKWFFPDLVHPTETGGEQMLSLYDRAFKRLPRACEPGTPARPPGLAVTWLEAKNVTCAYANRIVGRFHACRDEAGGPAGRCASPVGDFRCVEGVRKQAGEDGYSARVTCANQRRTILHDYTQRG